jgi:hypothetical protein
LLGLKGPEAWLLEVDYRIIAAELERSAGENGENTEEKLEEMREWKKCQKSQ